jgi:PPOX class probable FMN-dependent enzyme
MFEAFTDFVTSVEELRQIVGTPGPLALKKELGRLDEHMRKFIAHSPFLVMGTYGADGACDVSPRGDAPGFVQVLDDRTLVIPDRAGNKRVDNMQNILATGRIGLIFFVPSIGETLRVNGRARLVRDPAIMARMTANGKQPLLGIGVAVEQCFLQCAKAVIRSKLWEPHERPELNALPCAAEMLVDQAAMPEFNVESMQKLLDGAYRDNLY